MARYTGPVCRLCRREGMKLFLKGERCFSSKCAIEKRNTPPGQHGAARRPKIVGYGLQLREKQKARRIYGVLERQFRGYFERASRQPGVTGELLLRQLELRLDAVTHRLGFATSRAQARQLVRHGHILVNGKKVTIPSFQLKPGDTIAVREKSRQSTSILSALEFQGHGTLAPWLELNREQMSGRLVSLPQRADLSLPLQEQMIVELYSK
ncbi:MAG: 30S ribosomal protein S4 [Acidobacteria bacterium]|nr:MAG: 30S ribosomal protein S4 [Acidobacteriota bacterium]